MPLSELSELVARIDGTDLTSPEARSALTEHIGQVRAMLDRVGASESAAHLGVAGLLLQRAGDEETSSGEDAKRMVRTLLVTVEQSFRLPPATPATGTPGKDAPAGSLAQRKPSESSRAKRCAAELAVVRNMLLGEILVHFGVLAQEEISAALELQRETGQDLGDILVEHDLTTRDEVQRALDYQNTIRRIIASERKEAVPPQPAAEQPSPILPASSRVLGRLRLATELLLGETLILQGTITREGLKSALELQRSSGMLIGEALIKTGGATRAAIEQALVTQGRGDRIARNRPA